MTTILIAVVGVILFLMAVIDFEREEIPHTLTIILLALGIFNVCRIKGEWYIPVIYSVIAFIFLLVLYIFSNIGGGDVKVLTITMLFLNDMLFLGTYCIFFTIAIMFGIVFMILHKSNTLRLAPYMGLGLLSTLIFNYSNFNFHLVVFITALFVILLNIVDFTIFRKEKILNEKLF